MTGRAEAPRRRAAEPGSGRRRADRRRQARLRVAADGVVAGYLLDATRASGRRPVHVRPALSGCVA